MMIEIVIWEGAKAAGIVFWPVLKSLAEESAKDYGKDFFKDCLKKVIHLPEKDVQKEAYLTALKEFLQLFQQELKNADYQEGQIKQYLEPIQKFIEQPKVAAILGNAFEVNCKSLDISFLAKTWQEMNLPFLPEDFDWELIGKLYIRGVKQIITKSEKLRPIYEVQLQAKQAEGIQELVGIAPDFDLGRYAESLMETYSNLRLDSLEIDGFSYRNLQLYKIFIPQNIKECQEFLPPELPKEYQKQSIKEVYPELSQHTTEELEQRHKNYINQKDLLIWEVIGEPNVKLPQGLIQHTVIFGDPGSGKSSLLQYLALNWAQRLISELSLYRLPLLVELRLYGRDKQLGHCKDLLSFIGQGDVPYRLNQIQLHEKLKTGSVIALFDGIDEIFDLDLRDRVVMDIHRFSNDYPQVQIITTSRRLGYQGERLRNAGFQHFMLQDLKIGQIEDFIERWHNLTFTNEVDKLRKKERLIKAIRDFKSIRELAGNPLLLTMMAILNRNQELPRNRSELYKKASEVLLHQWDVEVKLLENPKLKDRKIEIALIDKQKMLQKVAYFMQSNKNDTSGNLIRKSDLENILTESLREIIEQGEPRMIARIMIEELRTRNFILCFWGADSYGFVHRTFLEYFCASEFVWQFKDDQTLTIDQLINEVFGQHWQDESWHEVLRLICGMIEPKFVAEIIDYLLDQKINRSNFLDRSNNDFLTRERRVTKEGLTDLILAANCFAEIRNKNLIVSTSQKLFQALRHEVEQEFPYQFMPDAAFDLLLLIAKNWQDEQETLPWLKHCLKFDLSSFVPAASVKAIAEVWNDSPDILLWLKELALVKQENQNDDVQKIAVQSIAKYWLNHPETLSWLKQSALINENSSVRREALRILAKELEKNEDSLLMVKNHALQDDSWFVRCTALEALARYWKEAPDTLPLLKDRALQDENEDVRRIAVTAIAQEWKEYPATLPWLKDRAQADKSWFVRTTTMVTITTSGKEDFDTLSWLKDRALQDADYQVRESAMYIIIGNSQKDQELFEFLAFIALNDPFKREYFFEQNIRKKALEFLLECFNKNPRTLEILNQVALNDSDEQLREFAVKKLQDLKSSNP
jgi:predicted NACHT family NTPase